MGVQQWRRAPVRQRPLGGSWTTVCDVRLMRDDDASQQLSAGSPSRPPTTPPVCELVKVLLKHGRVALLDEMSTALTLSASRARAHLTPCTSLLS
jgi:hypothetical protein